MAGNDGQERTEEATPRRRQDARKRGTVAKSPDLTGALVLLALCLSLPSAASLLAEGSMKSVRLSLANLPTEISPNLALTHAWMAIAPALLGLSLIIGVVLVVGVAANLAQVGFVMSGEALMPQLQRIDPFAGLKRMFSGRSVVEGLKAFIKFLLFGYLAYSVVKADWNGIIGSAWLQPGAAAAKTGQVMHLAMLRIAIVWLTLAIADYIYQRKQVDKQLRMTKDELKREFKEQEGSPEIKAAIAQRRRKLAKGRMMDRVRSADVLITNPTHYAVAIQYDRSKQAAPIVVAKGVDYMALRMREVAGENKVPIVPNPPLARALYKQCEVGDFIPRDMFQAVAEVLAYVYRTIKKIA